MPTCQAVVSAGVEATEEAELAARAVWTMGIVCGEAPRDGPALLCGVLVGESGESEAPRLSVSQVQGRARREGIQEAREMDPGQQEGFPEFTDRSA